MFTLLIFNAPLNPVVADLSDDYFEDFEGSVFPAWKATGLWHIEDNDSSSWAGTTPWPKDLPSDSHFAWYGNNQTGNYVTLGEKNNGTLTSDSINLTKLVEQGKTPIELGFWSWAETENLLNDPAIDRKEIFISKDRGLWDYLGQIPDSDYEWQYWGFDLTPYADSEDVRIRFSFDTNDEYANDYRGWMLDNITIGLPRPRFELFIMQEFSAYVGETRPIDFQAKSFFGNPLVTNITITMETPSGYTETLHEEKFSTVEAYGKWDHNIQYEFKEVGTYFVHFKLTDFDTKTEWFVDCWWDISEKPQNEFLLRIEQDYYAGITDNRKMGFFIDSFFDISVQVNVTIKMENPNKVNETLFYEPFVSIDSYSLWEFWLDYTFTQIGEYWVYFIVEDESGVKWAVSCPWEIETNFFDLWIDQDMEAGVTEVRNMHFYVKSYFDYTSTINISIDIQTPGDLIENLYTEYFVDIGAFGFWDYGLEYEFLEAGEYMILFSIVNETGHGWARECPWCIEKDFIGVWIDQDTHAFVGETHDIGFRIKNYYNLGMDIDYIAEMTTPGGSTDALYQETGIWINAYEEIGIKLSYEFKESGEYKVLFRVTDTYGMDWIIDCLWKVEEVGEQERFELKIDQDTRAEVGDVEQMIFMVKSYFNRDMYVEINITIENPSGEVESLFYDAQVMIEAYNSWEKKIDYEFKEVGDYKVLFILTDDIGTEWVEDCNWDISEPSTEETSSEESSPPTIGVTPGFEGFLIIGVIATIAIFYRKRHI